MNMPKEFVDMVKNDIVRIDESMDDSSEKRRELFLELNGKYQGCIADWGNSMWGYYSDLKSVYIDDIGDLGVKDNLKIAKGKLLTFQFGMNAVSLPELPKTQINISNSNSLQVDISFDDVRSQIDDMTSLTDEETKELLEKVNELEEIVNSSEKKKTKWQRVTPILKWLADKSFDAAMTVLPLILKLQG